MSRNIRTLLLASATAAMLAGFTAAASAMTMSVGDPSLTAKVLVNVPITASCSPFDPSLTPFSSGASVFIEQAVGKSIARGSGFVWSFWPSPVLLPCDSIDHTIDVGVVADPAGPPFRHGDAAVRVSASTSAGQQCAPNSPCFFTTTTQSASLGPIALKIH
jgi:hypothetical protein